MAPFICLALKVPLKHVQSYSTERHSRNHQPSMQVASIVLFKLYYLCVCLQGSHAIGHPGWAFSVDERSLTEPLRYYLKNDANPGRFACVKHIAVRFGKVA